MSVIEDGRGTGNKALVDDHGRIATKSITVSHMAHHATYHKNAYFAVFETTLAGTSLTNCAFLLNNDVGTDVEIYDVVISSDANIEISTCVKDTYTSGGAAILATNTNLGVSTTPSVESYEGGASADLVLSTTNSKEIDGAFIGAHRPIDMNYDGALVLTYRKSLTMKATGAATDKVKVTIVFAFHAAGTKL